MALFGIAEFTARAIEFRKLGPHSQQPRELRDRYAGWRSNPAFSDIFIHHNAEGFRRDADTPLTKPANTVRIFLLGGSVAYGTEGIYPEIENRPPPRGNQTIDYYLEHSLNARFPEKHWEVINAAVPGYRLHQDLARLLSVVLRDQPDYVVSLDGANDIGPLLKAPPHYDPYLMPEWAPGFDQLANPASFGSLRMFATAWLRNNSVLVRLTQDWMVRRATLHDHQRRALAANPKNPARWEDLTPAEQTQFTVSASQLDSYLREVRQIHAILAVDQVRDLFVLQPELLLSSKPLVGTEPRLDDLTRRLEGNLYAYGLTALYPKLADELQADASDRGYGFLNLTDAFDGMPQQAFTDYCHLTPEANQVVAERIFDILSVCIRVHSWPNPPRATRSPPGEQSTEPHRPPSPAPPPSQ